MRSYGYSTYFRPPKKHGRYLPLFAVLFCVIFPPLGLLLVWGKTKGSTKSKLILSAVAVVCMVVFLTVFLSTKKSVDTITYKPIQAAVQPTIVGDETVTGEDVTEETQVIPANPVE